MRGFNYYVVLFRIGTPLAGLIMVVLLGALVVSCSEIERQKVLTFFFEGVPPMGQEQFPGELDNNDSQTPSQNGQQQLWYVHEPRKDCTNCHDRTMQSRFKPRTFLKKPVPELCYGCHDDFTTTSVKYVHGPVAVGQCLLCHHHHQSRIEHLLKKPEPQLCYQCHNVNMISAIPAHLTGEEFACTDCHDPHTSSIKYLLKETSLMADNIGEQDAPLGKAVQIQSSTGQEMPEKELYDLTQMTGTTINEKNSMFQVFWTVSKLIEKGQIKEARAYLEQFKQSNAFTDEQWRKIVQVLNVMGVAGQTEQNIEKSKQQGDTADIEQQGRESNSKKTRELTELYYRSMAYYYSGQLEKAREGLLEVLQSESIPPAVVKTIKDDLAGIDSRVTVSGRKKEVAELYYRSMAFYHAGQYEKARKGLVEVLNSGLVPAPMIITIKDCLIKIDKSRAPE